jgi:hypothetical protein
MGNQFRMDHALRASTRGNLYLLLAGAGAMVVATVGLFVRASPTLSGAFLVVGAALLVVAVFAPEHRSEGAATTSNVDLELLERDDLENAPADAPTS